VSPIFLDTVGLLALWDADDQWHDQAEASFSKLVGRVKSKLIGISITLGLSRNVSTGLVQTAVWLLINVEGSRTYIGSRRPLRRRGNETR
jgi:predicted nucleic acid-binding protein